MLKDLIKKKVKKTKPKDKGDKAFFFENELEISVYKDNKLISQTKHK